MANIELTAARIKGHSLPLENVVQGSARPRGDAFIELVDSLMQIEGVNPLAASEHVDPVQKNIPTGGRGRSHVKANSSSISEPTKYGEDKIVRDIAFLATSSLPAPTIETRISINLASPVQADTPVVTVEVGNFGEAESEQSPVHASIALGSGQYAPTYRLWPSNERTATDRTFVSTGKNLSISHSQAPIQPEHVDHKLLPDFRLAQPVYVADYRSQFSVSVEALKVTKLQAALPPAETVSLVEKSDHPVDRPTQANSDISILDARGEPPLSQNSRPAALKISEAQKEFNAIPSAKEAPRPTQQPENSAASIIKSQEIENLESPRFLLSFPMTVSGNEETPLSLGNSKKPVDFASVYAGDQDLQFAQLAKDISALKSEKGSWSFLLKPDHLGAVDVTVFRDGTSLTVDLSTSSIDGRAIIAQATQKLEQDLRQKGFAQVEAQVSGESEQKQQHQHPHSQPKSHAPSSEPNSPSHSIPPAAIETSAKPQSGLFA